MGSLGQAAALASFEDFWASYPRRQKRDKALREWEELNPNAKLVRTILDAIARQKTCAEWQREGGRFVPVPAKWIHDRRWEDGTNGKPQKTATDYLLEAKGKK